MTVTEELPSGPPTQVDTEGPGGVPPGPSGPSGPGGPSGPSGPSGSSEPPPLQRSRTKRLVAGVCGGIADRFEVEVTIVRVAFVVAACLWGLGVVVYLALWALLPTSEGALGPIDASAGEVVPGGSAGPEATVQPDELPWGSYVLLTAALFLGLIVSTLWWGGPRWGGGLGLAWLVVLFAVVVVALRRPGQRLRVARVLLSLALVVLSVIILAAWAFFSAVALSGVPLTGGIGQQVVQPTTPAQLRSTYRLAVGSLTVDLTHVPLAATASRTVTASVAVGSLVVNVPRGVVVDVDAHTGIGNVSYGTSGPSAFAAPMTAFGPARPQLVIDAQVGMGHIQLERDGV